MPLFPELAQECLMSNKYSYSELICEDVDFSSQIYLYYNYDNVLENYISYNVM